MHFPRWADDDRRQDQGHRLRRRLRHRHRERRRRRCPQPRPGRHPGRPGPVAEGSTHTYSYTTTDDGAPETFSRDAQSCDGGTLSGDTFNPVDGSGSFDCTYADGPSAHNPSVTVSDGDGGSDSDSVAVTVTNVAPTIAIRRQRERERGLALHAQPGRGHRPGNGHRHRVRRPLGRRRRDTYSSNGDRRTPKCDGPDEHAITVDLVRTSDLRPDAANDHSVHVDNVAPTIAMSGNPNVGRGARSTRYNLGGSPIRAPTPSRSTGRLPDLRRQRHARRADADEACGRLLPVQLPGRAGCEHRRDQGHRRGRRLRHGLRERSIVTIANVDPVVTAAANQSSDEGDCAPSPSAPSPTRARMAPGTSGRLGRRFADTTSRSPRQARSASHTYADGPNDHTS